MRASRHALSVGRRVMLMAGTAGSIVLIAAAARAAPAQAPDGPAAAWRVECTGDGKTLDCRAVQQVFQRETRQLVLSAVVRPAADAKTGAMVLTLPLGLNLTEPVTIKVDNGAAERQPIQNLHQCRMLRRPDALGQDDCGHADRGRSENHRAGRQQEAGRYESAAARLRGRIRQGEVTRRRQAATASRAELTHHFEL